MSTTGIIFDLKRFAVHDGPGIRTTVFLKGCPLSCAWCHNPESRAREPEPRRGLHARTCLPVRAERIDVSVTSGESVSSAEAGTSGGTATSDNDLIGRVVSADSVLSIVRRDRVFYDESGGGMTLSGGEPLLQPDFAAALLAGARAEGIRTAVDTSGAVSWRHFEAVLPYADLFLYDLKIIDEGASREWVGADTTLIRRNLERLLAAGADVRIRIPLIPEVTDTDENLTAIADLVSALKTPRALDLLPYNPAGEHKTDRLGLERRLPNRPTQPAHELERIRGHFNHLDIPVSFGGSS